MTIFSWAILVALMAVATPAMAFDTTKLGQMGSLFLDDLTALIARTPKLKGEIDAALAQATKQASDIPCDGMRFPGQWVNLGRERVSPYTCDFGGRWLVIKATVRVTGRSRQVYDTITPASMKNAIKVSEINPTWTWTTEDPNKE
jgi:hypothetical protein